MGTCEKVIELGTIERWPPTDDWLGERISYPRLGYRRGLSSVPLKTVGNVLFSSCGNLIWARMEPAQHWHQHNGNIIRWLVFHGVVIVGMEMWFAVVSAVSQLTRPARKGYWLTDVLSYVRTFGISLTHLGPWFDLGNFKIIFQMLFYEPEDIQYIHMHNECYVVKERR